MSNVISFNVYKNTLRRSSGNDPVSSESGYTEILCRFKEGDDWEGVNGGIVTAGFFVSEDNVEQMTAYVANREARFTIPGTLVGNSNPIFFGIAGSISTGENSYITIATNVVKLDVIRGVVIDRLSPDAEADENHYAQLLATLNTGLTNVYTKAQIDTRFELHLSVAFDENGVPVKWDNKTTYSAGDFADSRIVKAFIASNVTRLDGGTFAQTNLTDIYIDNVEGAINIQPSAYPAGTTVHYKGEFNAVGFIVRAMKYFEENKADKANVYTKSEVDVALAGKAATSHTHSEYLTAQDISGKYEKPSGGIPKTDLSSEVQASLGKADSALQSHQSLANYYNKTEVDGALAGKAAASHTHSEYLTAQDINGKEDKANKVASNMASIDGLVNMTTKYPSVYAVKEYLNNYFYSRSEIDRFTYTKDEVDTALDGKADIADIPFATPEQYGAKGDGVTDDTAAINACLAENEIVLFSGIYLVNPTANQLENSNYRYGISVPSNRIIFFEKNAELICKETGENYYYTVLLHEASNVLIDGMTLHGNRATEQSITSPRATCHGLEILGCENIQIKNTSVDKFIGDGLGVWVSGSEGTEGEYTICRDIEMSNCAVFENRRNGITIGGVEGFRAVACKIYNNGTPVEYGGEDSGSAQPPQAGVDIEPNYSHVPVKNLTFEDCLFYGNGGFDFINQNGTQERLSLINCDCLGGDGLYQGNVGALFRASSVIVTGGHYRRIGIGRNVTAAVISGAYINEIMSAVTKKGVAFFDSCIIDGLLNSGGAERTIKTNSENNMAAICELKNCTIKNCLPNTGYSLGTISLEGCYVEQPEGQWLNNGHLDAKNTKFHFENNTTANVIWAKTNEFINCDFYYNEGRNYFIHTDDSATSKLWYNNRFYNDIYTLSPKANRLIKNWFNFASNKISGTATGEQIGNIFTDKSGSQIVSAVVNQNGTITFTDSDGNTFTTSGSKLVISGSEQISMGYDSGGFYFLFDDGQEAS